MVDHIPETKGPKISESVHVCVSADESLKLQVGGGGDLRMDL
jgi:hypothetical protein